MRRRQNRNILSPEKLLFPPTYMKSTSKTTFQIVNNNSEHFRFEWRLYSSEAEEKKILNNCDILDPNGRNSSSIDLL